MSAGGLHKNIAVIKKRADKTGLAVGYIFNKIEFSIGDIAMDNIGIININNSFLGNDADIVEPGNKTYKHVVENKKVIEEKKDG